MNKRVKSLWNRIRYLVRFRMIPREDDADRAYCVDAGKPGHICCGICKTRNKPRFMCSCDECSDFRNGRQR